LLIVAAIVALSLSSAAQRRFTVADDVGLSYFGVPNTLEDAFLFSPDGQYFVVHTERGRVDLNRPESTLRIYRTEDVRQFLRRPGSAIEPPPVWTVSRSTYKYGPVISNLRWLADSSGLAFLAKTETGNDQLLLAEIRTKTLHELTRENRRVTGFDIRSATSYIYCVLSPQVRSKAMAQTHVTSMVGTGRDLDSIIFPDSFLDEVHDRSELWAVVHGKRFRINDPVSSRPLSIYSDGQRSLAMSPNGRTALTALAVDNVPTGWEKLYPPPMPNFPVRIRSRKQDLEASDGLDYVSRYVLIDLLSGKVKPLSDSPLGDFAGWRSEARAGWSADGRSVVLSGLYVSTDRASDSQSKAPCVAVVDLPANRSTCLEQVYGDTESGFTPEWHDITNVRFAPGSSDRVIVERYYLVGGGERREIIYVRSANGSWIEKNAPDRASSKHPFSLSIRQSLNEPPVLVATDSANRVSRVLLDPNPQLKGIMLGEVSVYRWKDNAGRDQVGGLYKPPDYIPGKPYPLVLQTHGFVENEFSASGAFPTAFAAQELAAAGILVLQVRGSEGNCAPPDSPKEAECEVENYEAAVRALVSDGMADPERVGIIGFSRTCYHVLATLTTGTLHYRAASITDGINGGYFQYIMDADLSALNEFDAIIGEPPFGKGLQTWLLRSPDFNMDRVTTPLQIVAIGKWSALSSWEPYAALRYLHKAVDLIVFTEGQHVMTNPLERTISQGGTVDWFRFWLKDEEDPDPSKAEQYARWRDMRIQKPSNPDRAPD